MGKAIPINLGVRNFKTKTEARIFFQEMLASYQPGQKVKKSDCVILKELIKRHPESALKIGAGVDHFEVHGADFDSQCFHVYRTDGTFEDFSLHACVDGF